MARFVMLPSALLLISQFLQRDSTLMAQQNLWLGESTTQFLQAVLRLSLVIWWSAMLTV